jgi:hypothetical protein
MANATGRINFNDVLFLFIIMFYLQSWVILIFWGRWIAAGFVSYISGCDIELLLGGN